MSHGRPRLGPADAGKRWTDYDDRALKEAVLSGRLPDGTPASQNRLARYLGFSRQTIATKLNGRKLPLCAEAMSDGGRMSQYVSKVRKAVRMLSGGQK